MTYLDAVILGVIQALTEFLPVSSSGHLVLGQALFGIQPNSGIAFEIMVHLGTLFSVVFCYRQDLKGLLSSLLPNREAAGVHEEGTGWSEVSRLVVGCLPAGIVGVAFKDQLEQIFGSPQFVGMALVGTGVVLLSTQLTSDRGRSISVAVALLIGLAQAIAILPGVSRAGATIAMAMWLGVSNARAARFSFFLSIPVIAGASILQIRDLAALGTTGDEWSLLLLSAGCAFVCGILALRLLLLLLDRGVFSRFGWYCLAVGGIALSVL
jgi:undecaprenyl-diphosphatase